VTRYVVARLATTLPVIVGVTLVAFALTCLLPGDPARALAGERYREEDLVRIRHELGLDLPLPGQYLAYVGRLAHGDLGDSFATGTIAAWRRGGIVDRLSMLFALSGISIPVFVSAILFLWLFALVLRWVPPSGYIDVDPRTLILPAVTLGVRSAAVIARMTRSSMIEVLSQDFIRTGRAKGLRDVSVVLNHGLRNALVPVVTLIGLDFGSYLSGSVLTESIFAWPGVGQYALQAILRRDFPAIQGTVLFLSLIFVFVNLAVDLMYGALDPRIRRTLAAEGRS
jgi:ABC-type dipeptide/oligopeptide/nickel transport system permease component